MALFEWVDGLVVLDPMEGTFRIAIGLLLKISTVRGVVVPWLEW